MAHPFYRTRILKTILLIGLISIANARADKITQVFHFDNLNFKQGLSQSTVKDIVQGPQGFIWLATYDGLNRYDGHQFKTYRSVAPSNNDLASNLLSSLAVADELIWVGTLDAGVSSFNPKNNQFRNYRLIKTRSSAKRVLVNRLFTSRNGDLLVGTKDHGAFVKRSDATIFYQIKLKSGGRQLPSEWTVKDFTQTSNGKIWIATQNQGLWLLNSDKMTATQVTLKLPNSTSKNLPLVALAAIDNSLFLASDSSRIYQIETIHSIGEKSRGVIVKAKIRTLQTESEIATLSIDPVNRELLVGTVDNGVHRFTSNFEKRAIYRNSFEQPNGISDNFIHRLFFDKSNVLWIGTDNGISKYSSISNRFDHWKISNDLAKDNHNRNMIWSFESLGDYYLIASEAGLSAMNRQPQQSTTSPLIDKLVQQFDGVTINKITQTPLGDYWFATSSGIFILKLTATASNSSENSILDTEIDFSIDRKLLSQSIVTQMHDSNNKTWVGSSEKGLYLFDQHGKPEKRFYFSELDSHSISSNLILDILEDSQGNIWIATPEGLNRKLKESDQFERFQFDTKLKSSISNNYVTAIYQSRNGNLWIGTTNGLNLYDPIRNSFRRYKMTDGLPNNQISSIGEDGKGNLWIATTNGLSKYHSRSDQFINYFASDGLQSNEFNRGAIKLIDDQILVGGNNGFNRFNPQQLAVDNNSPTVVLTNLLLLNKTISKQRNRERPIFEGSINQTKSLSLQPSDNMLTIEFSALHFDDQTNIKYAYTMQGYDQEWIQTDATKRFATYTSLPPGQYLFKIKAANKDGLWNPQSTDIQVTMLPPWWLSWWAYGLYAAIFISLFYSYNRAQKLKLRREQKNSQDLRELDRIKDEFLAKTSHELRTPLNGIIGLSDSLIAGITGPLPEKTTENLQIISSSGKRLAKLVNDILDFSQLEHQGIQLQRRPLNLASIVRVIITLCEPLLADKPVKIFSTIPQDLPKIDGDQGRIEQILVNLIGNAINHTEQGEITIDARVSEQMILVDVSDSGSGIPTADPDLLFASFSQFNEKSSHLQTGVGLGLAITKHLVSLHGGSIKAENTAQGSRFSFTLPIDRSTNIRSIKSENMSNRLIETKVVTPQRISAVDGRQHFAGTKQRILVADDEQVNCQVVANFLAEKDYDVTIVGNGEQVIQAIDKDPPYDLVVLDVVMPIISGYEVCKLIRKDQNYFELPILMLSAKTQANDIVVGLQAGANDYVSKPIDKAEFLARVETLLNLKQIHVLRQQRDKATYEASENLELALHRQKYDSLTGLPNRNTMRFRLRQAILQADNQHQSLALLFVGLDKFGQINERLGHERGDNVLKEIALRLRNSLRDNDTIVRFESDTFVIGVYELEREKDIEKIKEVITSILTQVNRVIEKPIVIDEQSINLSASIGVSIYPYTSNSVDELFRHADIALHHAKSNNKGESQFFSDALYRKNSRQYEMETSLRSALSNHELFLVYQPQVLINSQQVIGAEALIRWQSAEHGLVSPATFIPIAEDIGIINEIGQWVISQACSDIKKWKDKGVHFGKIAVNLSAHQFKEKSLPKHIGDCISFNQINCEDLELEITEGILVDNIEKTKCLLDEFKEMGHQISIDDFGTGYSSLSYLKQFPIHTLKIDQSFIRDLLVDSRSKAIVKSIIDLAKGLGLETIAEGVETAEQWQYLKELECDQVQGYLISKPVLFDEFDCNLYSQRKLIAVGHK